MSPPSTRTQASGPNDGIGGPRQRGHARTGAASPGAPAPAGAHLRAVLTLVLCGLLWSMAGVVTRHLHHAEGFEITFWRSLFCALGMLAWLGWQGGTGALVAVRATGWPGVASGLMWAVMFTCFMLALTRTSVANTLLVLSIAPLLAAVLARVVLREPIRPAPGWRSSWPGRHRLDGPRRRERRWHGWHADRAGGADRRGGEPGDAPAPARERRPRAGGAGRGPDLVRGDAARRDPFRADAHDLLLLAFLGVFQLALPCALMVRAARHLSPQEISLLALLEVVFGPIWAWIGAGEVMASATIQGGLLVLGALVANETLGGPRARMRATMP
ncbi:MAG: DMT family transporter [Burkholderiaceae bacterium]